MSFARTVAAITASLLFASTAIAAPAFKIDVTGNATGAPMILIPGLASSGAVWDGTVQRYCGARRCHVLTLAGFAGLPAIDGPLLATAEQQLSEYIAANKLAQPVIVGHSLGGFLALKLAADHPEQVGRLVIVDSLPAMAAIQMPSITGPQMKEMAAAVRTRMLSRDTAAQQAGQLQTLRTMITGADDVQRALAWGQQSDRTTVANAMAELMGEDLRQEVSRIRAPTLVLGSWIAYKNFGNKEQFQQAYQGQYSKLAGVKVEMADTALHFIMLDDPSWMYDRIDQFLK
ncbi:UNVERIFIED_ORG: pimeloyl-ACP methyl ester carboxylesterase [Zoogloea ramigera]|uniref:Alpha/beta hydrolase n=1 Tax=Duganella zoogloeoides TaxID=75659 RepID=A0ABZ0XVC1_9BURK|nr:alpha/beta hydrolase [Duganella zoogloeoides]WQH03212.1 alpha/beta hydrolase [Duganella zoogloeoides]